MSHEKATEANGHTNSACWHYWQAAWSMAIPRPIAFLAVFISLSGLFGVSVPTSTLALTASSAPHLDANGWTVFTPTPITSGTCGTGSANGTCIFYISDSDGNDTNDGLSPVPNTRGGGAGPVKTISAGLQKLYTLNGKPTWLLLKKGDAFTNQVLSNDPTGCCFYGRGYSADQPMVISSYDPANPTVPNPGTGGARPLIKTPAGINGLQAQGGTQTSGSNYLAIVGIEFYAYTRDPSFPGYNTTSAVGLYFLNPVQWLLVEDCKFSFYTGGIDFNLPPSNNVAARRNVVVDSYDPAHISSGIHSWGITTGFLVEENVVDHNGWNATAQARGNSLNHNLYLSGDSSNPGPVTLRGNIISNDTSGSQIRIGGTIANNLWIQNGYAHNFAMPTAGAVNTIDNNVYTEAVQINGGLGWGMDVLGAPGYSAGTVTISNNILTQSASPTGGSGILLEGSLLGATLTNNIIYKWPDPIDQTFVTTSNSVTLTGYNIQDPTGANNLGIPEPFSDPNRTVGTYYDSIVKSPGHTSADLIAAARKQSKDNWNPALTAAAVNDYIRAGFGIITSSSPPPPTASPPPPTADTTSPSVPTGVAATAVSGTQVNLSWTASTDNLGVAGYKVFRNGTQAATATTTSYQDTGLSGGTAYSYTVAAYDAAGNTSAQSASASLTTPAPTSASAPSVAINSPTNGSVLNGSANIAVSANSANGIASITITADGNPLATCASVNSCATTWQKKKITQGTHSIGAIATDAKGLPAKTSVTIVTR